MAANTISVLPDMLSGMDNGWAIIVGAAIALIASIVTPWVKEVVERKHRAKELQRVALAASLRRISRAAPTVALASSLAAHSKKISAPTLDDAKLALERTQSVAQAQAELIDAIFELALLLPKSDAPIEAMARFLFVAIDGNNWSQDMGAFSSSSSRWYRGEVTASQALSEYLQTATSSRA